MYLKFQIYTVTRFRFYRLVIISRFIFFLVAAIKRIEIDDEDTEIMDWQLSI